MFQIVGHLADDHVHAAFDRHVDGVEDLAAKQLVGDLGDTAGNVETVRDDQHRNLRGFHLAVKIHHVDQQIKISDPFQLDVQTVLNQPGDVADRRGIDRKQALNRRDTILNFPVVFLVQRQAGNIVAGKIENEARHRHDLGIAQLFQIVFLRRDLIDILNQAGRQIVLGRLARGIVEE